MGITKGDYLLVLFPEKYLTASSHGPKIISNIFPIIEYIALEKSVLSLSLLFPGSCFHKVLTRGILKACRKFVSLSKLRRFIIWSKKKKKQFF